ncbi:hypothetical protein ACG02S_18235 [Roseateles sp. DC23W]|uniref:Uncharacterized protein n=1 Tax=Pelomonas dachongensis TaxID=3299029 RepID=A0ABW7EQW6_9BURK
MLPLLVVCLSACQPTLNWREARPEGAGVAVLFPCKPDVEQRPARPGQGAMGLARCEAGGLNFALSWADLPDPGKSPAALQAMPRALAAKLGQPLPAPQPLQVAGMTPLPDAGNYRIAGIEGGTGVTRVAVFAHGVRVYQVLMAGRQDDAATWDAWVSSLRVGAALRPAG